MSATPVETGHPEKSGFQIASVLPILSWIRTYQWSSWLRLDLIAGITIAAFAVPESMAYATLAGLQPQTGLYASLIALLFYAIFGSVRLMSVGGTSALSIMVGGTLGGLALANGNDYLAAASLTAIIAGLLAIFAGVFRLGVIVNFVSESVLVGFSTGAAFYIGSSQLSKLFGIEGVQGNFFERTWNVIKNLGDTNGWTLALGLISIALLVLGEMRFPKLPTSLVVVLLAILVMNITNLADHGVKVAGHIPSGLPTPKIPTIDPGVLPAIVGLACGVFLLSYVEGISTARTLSERHKERVDANQELYANGAINVAAGIFQAYPVGGSMSRSAVAETAGAKTPLTSGVAAIFLGVVLLFLTGVFAKLPEATLAAVVLVAVKGLVDFAGLNRLWRLSRLEFAAAALTMAGVLTFGMLEGILIGAGFSVLGLIWRVSRPHMVVVGQIPGTRQFGDMARHPENMQIPGVVVLRADSDIVYPNVDAVKDALNTAVASADPPATLAVIDLTNTPLLDLAGIDMLDGLSSDMLERGVELRVAGATGPVRDVLRAAGTADRLGITGEGETIATVIDAWKVRGPYHAVNPEQDAEPKAPDPEEPAESEGIGQVNPDANQPVEQDTVPADDGE